MSFFRFFRSKPASPIRANPSLAGRRSRLRVEQLEARDVPTNDIFTVTGAAGSQVTLHFDFLTHQSVYWDELGVYRVSDDQGRVGTKLPTDAGYAKAALQSAQTVFVAGDFEGATKDLTFTAGTKLGFYMIQNNTLAHWRAHNPNNLRIEQLNAFFSIDSANRDHLDHVLSTGFGDRAVKLSWEDTFGLQTHTYSNNVIKVSYSTQDSILALGNVGNTVPTTFNYLSKNTVLGDEVGVFAVDDATGKIGTLNPGDAGYAHAVFTSAIRQVVFGATAIPGAVKNINLPGAKFFGIYVIRGGTTQSLLRFNPNNTFRNAPLAFFSFKAANFDGLEHIKWFSATKFGIEDNTHPIRFHFQSIVGTMTMHQPPNAAPTVKTAIANITGNHATLADQNIDLAGVFTDADLGNSLVHVVTNKGAFDLELFDSLAPKTVANFYNYIIDGDYNDAIFHRTAASPSIIQGGGFTFVNNGSVTTLPAIPTDPPVANEPDAVNRPNARGTIAMAKTSDPNSATSQFYFNVGDNSTALDNTSNSGGFTVFGRVVADQMHVVDQLAAIPAKNEGGVFAQLPMTNYTGTNFPSDVTRNNLIVIQSITVLKRPEGLHYVVVSNTNPAVATATLVHNHLTVHAVGIGATTITVAAIDRVGHRTTTSFTVTLSNNAPVTVADSYTGTEDAPLTVAANAGVLANDTDADNDPLTAVLVSDAAHGHVVLNSDGSFTYTPTADFSGVDTFTYKTNDGNRDGNTATVTINVTGINDAPVALDGALTTDEDTAATGTLVASDVDTTTLTITTVDVSNAHGTVVVTDAATGAYSYTPDANYNGPASFTFKANDGALDSNIATVNITVNPVNDPPVAVADANDTFAVVLALTGNVLTNDTDVDQGAVLSVAGVNGSSANVGTQIALTSGALLTVNADGGYSYDPHGQFGGLAAGETATDSFTYVVSDEHNATSTTTVTITIHG